MKMIYGQDALGHDWILTSTDEYGIDWYQCRKCHIVASRGQTISERCRGH